MRAGRRVLEPKRIHDLCLAEGVGVWCGGMLDTDLGRVANAALAALLGFTLPANISASARFYARDITTPVELAGDLIEVPRGVGFEVEPIAEVLDKVMRPMEPGAKPALMGWANGSCSASTRQPRAAL